MATVWQDPANEYVLDTDYTWGFYGGQSPAAMAYAARLNGVSPPAIDRPFRYLELGCGNGVTANVCAAMFPRAEFVALDINADHIANAASLASASGLSNVTFLEQSIGLFASRKHDPFDFISLHGVYSWVSESVRREIVNTISAHLAPGGLVYVSYNTMPGWAAVSPLRQLMVKYAEHKTGSSIERAQESIRYLEFLRDNDAAYFSKYPECSKFVDDLLEVDPKYVVHEYFNSNWQPQYFFEVATEMSRAGLRYCGTTSWSKNYFDISIPREFQEFLLTADSDFARETHKSLILNERFRMDVFAKSGPPVSGSERTELSRELIISSVVPEREVSRRIQVGDVNLNYDAEIYDTLIPILCEGRTTVGELWELPELRRYSRAFITDSVNNLVPGGQFQVLIAPAIRPVLETGDEFRLTADINRRLLAARLLVDDGCFQASSILGTALHLDVMSGLIVRGTEAAGAAGAVDWAVELLIRIGQTLQIDGERIEDADRCRQLLKDEQARFDARGRALLEKFGLIEAA